MNLAFRETLLQQAQHGKGVDDITQRTGFENENLHGGAIRKAQCVERKGRGGAAEWFTFYSLRFTPHFPRANRSANRCGRPAAMIFFWAEGMS